MSDIEARNAELVAYKEGINKVIYGGEEELRNMIHACDHLRGRVTVKLMEITGETSGKSLV